MKIEFFHLKYESRVSNEVIHVRKLADQRYLIFRGEGIKPENISGYSLRKDYKFITNSQPKIRPKIMKSICKDYGAFDYCTGLAL